jgi:hypothetical protein
MALAPNIYKTVMYVCRFVFAFRANWQGAIFLKNPDLWNLDSELGERRLTTETWSRRTGKSFLLRTGWSALFPGKQVNRVFWSESSASEHGCQMVYFQTKNPNLGKFWRVLQQKMLTIWMAIWSIYGHLVYFLTILYILWPFGMFWANLVYVMVISCMLWSFGLFYENVQCVST